MMAKCASVIKNLGSTVVDASDMSCFRYVQRVAVPECHSTISRIGNQKHWLSKMRICRVVLKLNSTYQHDLILRNVISYIRRGNSKTFVFINCIFKLHTVHGNSALEYYSQHHNEYMCYNCTLSYANICKFKYTVHKDIKIPSVF